MSRISSMPVERRRHTRTNLQMTIRSVRLDPDCGDVIDCLHMQNISRSGLGAVTDRAFYPGQRVILSLPIVPGMARKNVYARVVRCRRNRQAYDVGLEFETLSAGAWCGVGASTVAAA